MKERDITELLVSERIDGSFRRHIYRPFVILTIKGSAGYPVWLEVCHSVEEARIKATTRRQALAESPDQTVERYIELPSVEWPIGDGWRAMIYVAHTDLVEGPKSELLIGRISDNLYLWGDNPTCVR